MLKPSSGTQGTRTEASPGGKAGFRFDRSVQIGVFTRWSFDEGLRTDELYLPGG